MAHNIIYLMGKNIDRIDSKYMPEISGSRILMITTRKINTGDEKIDNKHRKSFNHQIIYYQIRIMYNTQTNLTFNSVHSISICG